MKGSNVERHTLSYTTPAGKTTQAAVQITPEEALFRIHHRIYSYITTKVLTSPYGLILKENASNVCITSAQLIS